MTMLDKPPATAREDQAESLPFVRPPESLVELGIRLAALGLLLYASVTLITPFITVVIWSVILTVALYPFYEWVARRLGGRRRLAAVVLTLFNLLVVIGPATWLILGMIESVRRISEQLSPANLTIPAPPLSIRDWPVIGNQLYDFLLLGSTNIAEAAEQLLPLLKPVAGNLLVTAASAGLGILMFFVSIIIAGFLFAPAPSLVAAVRSFSRKLTLRRGEEFVTLAGATIRTVSRGVVGISALQALLAGVGFAVAGVPGGSLLTSAVLILGIIQIGPAVVLVGVTIWAWMTMNTTAALVFTIYMVPVGFIDNVLRPLVMGRGLKTPMLVILVGVIGGTLAYGILGVFLGPIILAVIWELLMAWMNDTDPAASAEV